MNILIRNISCGCMILIGIAAIVTGAVFRKSYSDITQTTDYMDSMYVCEYQEGIVPDMTDDYIDRAAYVFVVEAYGYTKYMYQSICQKVKVVQVITGDNGCEGKDIFLYKGSWKLSEGNKREMSFVNELKKGEKYLVIAESKLDITAENKDIYSIPDMVVPPVFCLKKTQNVIVDITGWKNGYVPYNLVSDNEFFAASEGALEQLTDTKSKVLQYYGVEY